MPRKSWTISRTLFRGAVPAFCIINAFIHSSVHYTTFITTNLIRKGKLAREIRGFHISIVLFFFAHLSFAFGCFYRFALFCNESII